jgi:hypothetical protein
MRKGTHTDRRQGAANRTRYNHCNRETNHTRYNHCNHATNHTRAPLNITSASACCHARPHETDRLPCAHTTPPMLGCCLRAHTTFEPAASSDAAAPCSMQNQDRPLSIYCVRKAHTNTPFHHTTTRRSCHRSRRNTTHPHPIC